MRNLASRLRPRLARLLAAAGVLGCLTTAVIVPAVTAGAPPAAADTWTGHHSQPALADTWTGPLAPAPAKPAGVTWG
jgi:hypothetical protein